jgi:hypothetical protein
MSKIVNCLLLIGFITISAPLEAKTIKLAPNETKMFANNGPFTLNATCNVHGTHPIHSKIKVVVLKNKGIINGKNLTSGQGTSVTVKNDSNISVSADSGTQINLINLGSEHLEAVCSL